MKSLLWITAILVKVMIASNLPATTPLHSIIPTPILTTLPDSIQHFRFNAPTTSNSLLSTNPITSSDHSKGHTIQLNDLTLSSLALVVTVDGHVHAVQRETGQWLWTLHDDQGAALGLKYSKQQRQERSKTSDTIIAKGGALVKGMSQSERRINRKNASATLVSQGNHSIPVHQGEETIILEQQEQEEQEDEEEEEEVYIIEPHSAGDIYLYTRAKNSSSSSTSSSSAGSLQKLPLSMLQLVALSPFTFPSDSSRMFAGRKETTLVGVDLKSGRLVGVFGSGAGWCEWDEKIQGSMRSEEECDEEISRRPEDLLYLARTEYHLSIYSKTPYALLQTLTYTTYSSSSLTSSLQSRWTATPDSRYLQPMHDGSLICFLSGVPGLQWTIAFDVPVVAVFDIALAKATPGENIQPIMFEQPHPSPVEGLPVAFDKTQSLPETTFVGRVDGGLFAMSREHFPLVAFAPVNGADKEVINGNRPSSSPKGAGTKCKGLACLVGAHRLVKSAIVPVENTLDPPPEFLAIGAPPASTASSSAATSTPPLLIPSNSTPPPPHRSVFAAIYLPIQRLSTGSSAVIVSFLLIILGGLYARKQRTRRTPKEVEEASIKVTANKGSTKTTTTPHPKRSIKKIAKTSTTSTILPPSVLPSPASSTPTTPPLSTTPSLTTLLPSAIIDAPTLPITTTSLLPSLSSSPILREVSKDLPPLPQLITEDDDLDSETELLNGESMTPKRKGRRKRGKKTKKKLVVEEAELLGYAGGGGGELSEEVSLGQSLEELSLVDLVTVGGGEEVGMEIEESTSGDPSLIGSLSVSETILGYGSHGTIVLRGEFQGRAVAVKRLLKDFVTLATHEVALLQESDDHPNVIRYFCKEQRGTFLYIALELCPASLFELIDQPQSFPELVRELDPKRALRQITSGISHLHQLKIVHRDIKPQNILVARSQHVGGGVRMLISDFGLCKKLDMDESSFQQTVDHAAGSFGYRAPEVLRGQVDPNMGVVGGGGGASNSTTGSSTTTGSPTTDPSMRLTRSIDIFSLGCIFYYVLTGGEHPFGGRYEREMNILLGKASLERLDGLGEEALEVQDAITKMVATDPRERPSAESVILHPFFWNAQKRLLFICDASDRFEIMERDPPEATLVALEETSTSIVGDDWSKSIDRTLLDNLGKYRKYDGKSVRDLLRVLRNKKHHYQDLPENVRRNLGDLPGGFLTYFTARFPRLLLHVFDVVADHLSEEAMFKSTFSIAEES